MAAWFALAWMHDPLAGVAAARAAGSSRLIDFCTISLSSGATGSAPPLWRSSLGLNSMFLLMPVAMMLPTVNPMTRFISTNTIRRLRSRSVTTFLVGYLFAWAVFGVVASVMHVLVTWAASIAFAQRVGWLPAVESPTRLIMVATLVGAAIWQISPMKRRIRRALHAPRPFPIRGRESHLAPLRFGLSHGALCVGSCWLLMLVGPGVGSLPWMVAIACYVWLERTKRYAAKLARPSAAVLGAASLSYLLL